MDTVVFEGITMLSSSLHSYLLAEAFGLYLVIVSIILLSRENYYRNRIMQAPTYPSFLSCSIALFIGIFLVLIHNIWVLQPRVVVTILCWAFLIRAVLLLSAPEQMFMITRKLCTGKSYYFVVLFMAILGIWLMGKSSYLYMLKVGII